MEYQSLSKSDKKIIRELHDLGVRRRMIEGLKKVQLLQNELKNGKDVKDVYHSVYTELIETDKKIARTYDGLSGNNYLYIIRDELKSMVLQQKDLEDLSEETREFLTKSL